MSASGGNGELMYIRRLLEALVDTHIAVADDDAVDSTAYTVFAITGDTAVEADAEDIPDKDVRLSTLEVLIDGGAGGITSLYCYLSRDADGNHYITPMLEFPIAFATGSTSNGGFAVKIDVPYRANSQSVSGTIYLQAKADAGSCTAQPQITFVTKTPLPIPDPE